MQACRSHQITVWVMSNSVLPVFFLQLMGNQLVVCAGVGVHLQVPGTYTLYLSSPAVCMHACSIFKHNFNQIGEVKVRSERYYPKDITTNPRANFFHTKGRGCMEQAARGGS